MGGFYTNIVQSGTYLGRYDCGTRWLVRDGVTALALSTEALHPSLNWCVKRFLVRRHAEIDGSQGNNRKLRLGCPGSSLSSTWDSAHADLVPVAQGYTDIPICIISTAAIRPVTM